MVSFDEFDPGGHSGEAKFFGIVCSLCFRLAQSEHADQLLAAHALATVFVISVRVNPSSLSTRMRVQRSELGSVVVPVSGVGVDPCGSQESHLVVVAKRADRNPGEL